MGEKKYRRRKFVCCIRNVPSTELVPRRSSNRRGLSAQSLHPLCSSCNSDSFSFQTFSSSKFFTLIPVPLWQFRDRMGHHISSLSNWEFAGPYSAAAAAAAAYLPSRGPLGYLMDPIISPHRLFLGLSLIERNVLVLMPSGGSCQFL